ncbi:MAG: NAD-dependent epimerase/dehydratase family protein, partial [Planctomycetaceae bacterium]|nr:NAD-dependent epimerase/dehydratase family protein [Planctomycetaceae bacterium]
ILCRGDYPELRDRGVEIVRGDVRDRERVREACRDVLTVHHTAAIAGIWGDWSEYHSINTEGTRNIIDGCLAEGVGRLVHTSSPSVVFDGEEHLNGTEDLPYPNKYLCHYPRSKMLAERMVLEAHGQGGLATTALRPHLIWGPRDNHLIPKLIDRARSGKLIRVGNGENLISATYVENGAAAQVQAAERLTLDAPHGGKAYFINDPEPVKLWKWIDELLNGAGLPPVKRAISSGTAYLAGTILEGVHRLIGSQNEPRMTRFLALQLSKSHTYSIEGARRDFGFTPLVSHEEGMRRLLPDLERWGKGKG